MTLPKGWLPEPLVRQLLRCHPELAEEGNEAWPYFTGFDYHRELVEQ
jgi:hypothetical protein